MLNLLVVFLPIAHFYQYVPPGGSFSKRREEVPPVLISQQAQAAVALYNRHKDEVQL